jgi:hypothetical protein
VYFSLRQKQAAHEAPFVSAPTPDRARLPDPQFVMNALGV